MSEQRETTVGALTADDLGSVVEVGWLRGELTEVQTDVGFGSRALMTVQQVSVPWAERRSLPTSTRCMVTPKRSRAVVVPSPAQPDDRDAHVAGGERDE